MNKENSSKILNVASIIVAIILFFYALFNLADSKLAFLLIIIGAITVSPLSKKIFKSLDRVKQRIVRVSIPVITVLFGTVLSANSYSNREVDTARNYLKTHPDLVFLKQIDTLRYYENYFSGAYENDSDEAYLQKLLNQKIQSSKFLRGEFQKQHDSVKGVTKVIFTPEIGAKDTLTSEYQNKMNNHYIKNYRIVFDVEKEDVKDVRAIIDYSKNILELDKNNLPHLSEIISQDKVNSQIEYINARLNLLKGNKIKERFVKNCFDAFNGSHIGLVRLVKENMHDPSSFEHVDTSYQILGEFALITMRYRGNNKLGVLVINTIKAKVGIESCQDILEVLE